MLPVVGELRPWDDPGVVEIGRRPSHVPLDGFDRRSLDGRWSLELFDHPDRVPGAALRGDRPRAVTVDVPGNWTVQRGVEDPPHYTNLRMPFPGPPPRTPDRNPTGVYRRTFAIGAGRLARRNVLVVGGAESTHTVFVNGAFVGYGTDSRLPSEYDVSEHLVPGDNDLAIVVTRYSAQSYVEDQDHWWMAGLHRSVRLESRPRVHVCDLPIDTGLDTDTGSGFVEATAVVDFGADHAPGWRVRATLVDPSGRSVGGPQEAEIPHRFFHPYVFEGHRGVVRWDLPRALAWSAETPNRYVVTVELVDPGGRVRQTEVRRVGVRDLTVRDGRFLVNGRPVRVFGVNRHDHQPDRGKAVTADDMRADLVMMRRHNITAVRTAHYPNDSAFYDLCDELGVYVVDEANLESHAYNTSLFRDPRFRSTWVARVSRMVERDRNHTCVVAWSLGNESGFGAVHDASAAWVRATDPARPLVYEGAVFHDGWNDGGRVSTDLVCPMYPSFDDVEAYGRSGADRPLVMCEYSHAMGNSNGSLDEYWRLIESSPTLQGGFIWEWKDHGLRQRLPDGRVQLAYGGHFGDSPNDGNLVADGLVSPDLEPHPGLAEVGWVYRPVAVERARGGLRITNRRSFTDLGDLQARWTLTTVDGPGRSGVLGVPAVGPDRSVVVPLPVDGPGWLTIRWDLRDDAWFAPKGHVVSVDQVQLGRPRRRRRPPVGTPPGGLVTPRLRLWRGATDNDGYKLLPDYSRRIGVGGRSLQRWEEQGIDRLDPEQLVGHEIDVERNADSVTFRHVVVVPDELADLPRIGVWFTLPPRFTTMRWFGRGPHENYPDRWRSAPLGVWEGPPDALPYLVPQEFGLRTGCRWVELIDPEARERVAIDAIGPDLHVSAIHHTPEDLFAASTRSDLVHRPELVVGLDVAHRGVGTASCGPDTLPGFRIAPGRHEFAYRVTLLA